MSAEPTARVEDIGPSATAPTMEFAGRFESRDARRVSSPPAAEKDGRVVYSAVFRDLAVLGLRSAGPPSR